MDAKQFKLLLETLQQQQTQLLTQLTAQFQAASPKNDSSNFSSIAPFENYDPKKEKFTCYLERFGNYVAMKNITDKVKIAQLLCVSIGSIHYNNLAAFLGPNRTIQSLEYEALVNSFKQMLVPRKNVVVSQHYFLNIYQKDKQSVAEYVAALQRDLAECEFNIKCECSKLLSVADIFLRAQFIRGLRDNWLREQLLQSDMTRFDDILAKATALEASRIESKELTQNSNSQDNASFSETYKILDSNYNDTSRRHPHFQDSNFQYRRRSPSYGSSNRSVSRNRSQLDYRLLGIENLCFRCGRNNHKVSACRTDRNQVKCRLCSKEGHVSKVCITSLLKNFEQKQNSSSSTKYMNVVNHDDTDEDSGERVQARMFVNNKYIWQFGNIQKKLGHRHYNVTLDSGRSVKKHIDQLRSTLVTKKTVSFEPSTSFNVPRIPRTEMDLEHQNPSVPASPTTLQETTAPPTSLQEATIPDLATDIHSRPLRQRNLPIRFREFERY